MRPRQRESESVLVGMLLLYCLVFLISAGCSGNPVGGCPPDFRADDATGGPGRLEWTSPDGTGKEDKLDFNPFCIAFPMFCGWSPSADPIPELYAWGGPDFRVTPGQVPMLARWHNHCLSAWRHSRHDAQALLRTMDSVAAADGLVSLMDARTRGTALELFQCLLDGQVSHDMLPDHAQVMAAWQARPAKGPFAQDRQMEMLLQRLGDGISRQEVEDWRLYAEGKRLAPVREYWAAAGMAASVAWWYDFSQEVGENCGFGVFADLAAMQNSSDWRLVAIASLAGALTDVLEHFWPQE